MTRPIGCHNTPTLEKAHQQIAKLTQDKVLGQDVLGIASRFNEAPSIMDRLSNPDSPSVIKLSMLASRFI